MDRIEVLPNPTKSLNDVKDQQTTIKDYKCIKLPNGLMALLVSDTSYHLKKLDQEEQELEESKVAEDCDKENLVGSVKEKSIYDPYQQVNNFESNDFISDQFDFNKLKA